MKSLKTLFQDRKYQFYGSLVILLALGLLAADLYVVFGPLSQRDNLFALLFLRRDDIQNTVRAEIFPVARYSNGSYQDASIISLDTPRTTAKEQRSILHSARDFVVYEGNRVAGTAKITELDYGQFQCTKAVVGILDAKLEAEPDLSKGTHMLIIGRGMKISFSLASLPALSRGIAQKNYQHVASAEPKAIAAGLARLRELAKEEFGKNNITFPEDQRADDARVSDLDRDGTPELMIRFLVQVPPTDEDRKIGLEDDGEASLMLWAILETDGNVKPILSLFDREKTGSWGHGYTFLTALDIDGDGVPEVILRYGGYEIVEFLIFEFKEGVLRQVFRGAQYGC